MLGQFGTREGGCSRILVEQWYCLDNSRLGNREHTPGKQSLSDCVRPCIAAYP
ncbi:hypothetical protein RSAG8_11139, partial [Rhizoctonia solani AG-8 WAC10335]